ncbi:MAG: DUF4365 domain-containing protein [Candidatus Bathyarchaeia archaeon]
MSHIVRFPWEKRLGKVGETAVKQRLSYFSLTTKIEDDVGLDFYCELTENDSPTNEFYVQAKGTENFDEQWGQSIKKSTVIYWLLKPNPVYLVVYDELSHSCYWVSIEERRYKLIEKLNTTEAETIYFTLDRSRLLEEGKDKNNEFIQKIKDDKLSIELFHGRPTFKGEGYVKQLPDPPRNDNELVLVRENIRKYLYSLVRYYMERLDINTAASLCEFLTQFDPTGHYNHFLWLGQIRLGEGKKEIAKKYLEQALWICLNDKEWPKESMEKITGMIDSLIEECRETWDP